MAKSERQTNRHTGRAVGRDALSRFVAGKGQYIADIRIPGALELKLVRSPVPHAKIKGIDTDVAKTMPGVVDVITGADLPQVQPLQSLWDLPGQNHSNLKPLTTDKVLYVGHAYAAVVATSAEAAEDAAALIKTDFSELPHCLSVDAATAPDAVRLYDHWPDNVVGRQDWAVGDVDAAFEAAAFTVSDRFTSQRVHALPLEGRGVIAVPEADGLGVTVWTSTQSIHQVRTAISESLNLPEHRIRVIAPDVGGAFGLKVFPYGEETLLAALALQLKRPVRWIEGRREAFVGSTHGRDQRVDLAVAFDADGRILGLRGNVVLDNGAEPPSASFGPAWVTGATLTGPYRVPAVEITARGIVTNKTPTGAYRGFGQPESNFAMERLLDIAARTRGMDPAELRRRNFVGPDEMPFPIHSGPMLDSGRYADLLDATLERFGYKAAVERAESTRTPTRATGIGIASYSELTNLGPSAACKLMGVNSGGFDTTHVRMEPSGHVRLFIGQTPMGQGVETTLAQVCADELQIPLEDISVIHGDTLTSPYTAYASGASRGAGVAGATAMLASRKLAERLRRWGAHLLEVPVEETTLVQGGVQVEGDPVRRVSVAAIADAAYKAFSVPEGLEPGLEDRAVYDPPALAVTYGSVAVEVSVDLETGKTTVERMTFGHDCGVQINPQIVDGQVTGGVAQGIGTALFEAFRYDENGQPLTLSMHFYQLPFASDVPKIDLLHFSTPTPFSPIGAKGVGESGTIPVPAAIANAVQHAIGDATCMTTLPLSAEAVLGAIQRDA